MFGTTDDDEVVGRDEGAGDALGKVGVDDATGV
jgi:hypothetical protein